MANTENIEAKLCAYVDGELDSAGRAEIEAHLTANPQHRQLMSELMQQRELLGGLPRERAPEDLFEAMQNQLERSVLLDGDAAPGAAGSSPHVAGQINRWPQIFAAAAAVLMLAVGLAAVIYFVLPNQHQADYARVHNTGSPGPMASSSDEASRRLGTLAATQPGALARADADRMEAKTGSIAGKFAAAPADTSVDTAASTPTAVAVAPVAPAAPPAAAAAAPGDVFTKNAGNQSKIPGDLAAAQTMTNIFADAQLNEKLKDAPGVPDHSMLVVVNADDPSVTNQQIRDYLTSNGIKWEPAVEPMPPPLELRDSQTVMRSRLNQTQMNLKGGPEAGSAGAGQGYGGFGGSGGGGQAAPAEKPDAQKQTEVAQAEDASKLKDAKDADKDFGGGRSKVATPPNPARRGGGAAEPSPEAVATDTQNKQLREPDRSTSSAVSGVAGTGASPNQGPSAAAAAPQINGASGSIVDAGVGQKGWKDDIAGQDQTKRGAAADAVAQGQQPSQPQATPADVSSPPPPPPTEQSQSAAAPNAAAPAEQQQEQITRQYRQQQDASQLQPQQQPQQPQQQQQLAGQSPQTHQVFIARGLTKQQVVAMNSAISNGNRINNYNRAGDTITPTTLPTLSQAEPPVALAKKESESKALNANLPSTATTTPTGAAKAGALPPGSPAPGATAAAAAAPTTRASSESAFFDDATANLGAGTGAGASTFSRSPAPAATAPTTTPSTDGAGDRVDVVILVQPEPEPGQQQNFQQPAAPNAAAVEAPTTNTTAPAAAATAPATSPAQ